MNTHTLNAEKLVETPRSSGEVRGAALLSDAVYVRRHAGEEALERVDMVTREMDCPIDYGNVDSLAWYPAELRTVSLLAIAKALGWGDDEMREMGRSAPRYSAVARFMLRYFGSVEALAGELQTYWRSSYSTGSLRGVTIDRSAFVCLSDFWLPPILSTYLEGYFAGVLGMVIGKDRWMKVGRTGRWHLNSECHDFVLRW
jgi:hypothetical protein